MCSASETPATAPPPPPPPPSQAALVSTLPSAEDAVGKLTADPPCGCAGIDSRSAFRPQLSLAQLQELVFLQHMASLAELSKQWKKVPPIVGLPSLADLLAHPIHGLVPRGLPNYGMSCYLSASVQVIASIPPLRSCLLTAGVEAQRTGLQGAHVPVLMALLDVLRAMFCHARTKVTIKQFTVLTQSLYCAVVNSPARADSMPFMETADGSDFLLELLDDVRRDVASITRHVTAVSNMEDDGGMGGGPCAGPFRTVMIAPWETSTAGGSLHELRTRILPSLHAEANQRGFMVPSPLERLLSVRAAGQRVVSRASSAPFLRFSSHICLLLLHVCRGLCCTML